MTVEERIRAIRLTERVASNIKLAEKVGLTAKIVKRPPGK